MMSATTKPLSILLCEDDTVTLDLLNSVLSLSYPDFTIYAATSGSSGLQCFQQHPADIVITDINMPQSCGIEMARQMKAMKSDLKTIVTTAYGGEVIEELSARTGVEIDHYFLKPLVYKQLFFAIDDCVAQISRENGNQKPASW